MKESLALSGEDSPMANLMPSIMGAFAEFERALIKERQREGIALARTLRGNPTAVAVSSAIRAAIVTTE